MRKGAGLRRQVGTEKASASESSITCRKGLVLGVADGQPAVGRDESLQQVVDDVAVHDQPAQRGAALAGCPGRSNNPAIRQRLRSSTYVTLAADRGYVDTDQLSSEQLIEAGCESPTVVS